MYHFHNICHYKQKLQIKIFLHSKVLPSKVLHFLSIISGRSNLSVKWTDTRMLKWKMLFVFCLLFLTAFFTLTCTNNSHLIFYNVLLMCKHLTIRLHNGQALNQKFLRILLYLSLFWSRSKMVQLLASYFKRVTTACIYLRNTFISSCTVMILQTNQNPFNIRV